MWRGIVDMFARGTRMTPASDLENPITTRDPLTVTALNRAVAGLLSRNFGLVRVSGEIANLSRASSGHWYFTLKDAAAQVRCAMFRGRNALVGFVPREGDHVIVLAQVGLYEARGDFQLNVESMQQEGQGRLFEAFMRLKERLAAEGLFDASRKRPLPQLPRALGIVTSLQAAALNDVLTTLRRRAPYLTLIVYPVPVQGEGAGGRIAQMLRTASQRREVDVLLLVRGGGSIEDLWAFNEEAVARALRASSIPVVVGVGHESDFTIADFAADVRAPTPTAAAELAAPEQGRLQEEVLRNLRAMMFFVRRALETTQQQLDYAARAVALPPLEALANRVVNAQQRMRHAHVRALDASRRAVAEQTQRLLRFGPRMLARRPDLDARTMRLALYLNRTHERASHRLETGFARLLALDPTAVLARGFALVSTPGGAIVREAAQLALGDRLRVRWASSGVGVQVDNLEPDAG
jgi:exodeoxyribonuclease VII large subunit